MRQRGRKRDLKIYSMYVCIRVYGFKILLQTAFLSTVVFRRCRPVWMLPVHLVITLVYDLCNIYYLVFNTGKVRWQFLYLLRKSSLVCEYFTLIWVGEGKESHVT